MNKNILTKNNLLFSLAAILLLLGCDPNSKLALLTDGAGYCDEAVVTLAECCRNTEISPAYPVACKEFNDGISEADYYFLTKQCKEAGGGFTGGSENEIFLAKDARSMQCAELLEKVNELWSGIDGDGDVDNDLEIETEIDDNPDGDIETETDGDDTEQDETDVTDGDTDLACEEGKPCNDNDPCTVDDICESGICKGSEKDCSDLDSDCIEGYCLQGTCTTRNMEDGLDCDDDNVCTENDQCFQGQCKGNIVSNDAQISCDDQKPCTENDVCVDGICAGATKDCSSLDDGKCLKGVCGEDGECTIEAIADNTVCAYGDGCVLESRCSSGICEVTQMKDCSSLDDDCNEGECVIGTGGICSAKPINEDGECDDGNLCMVGDRCVQGVCIPTGEKDCDDSKTCTTDSCNETDGSCLHSLDEGYCFINDKCYADEYPNPENEYCERCEAATSTSNWTALSDVSCDDGDPCTVGDICEIGVCNSGSPKDCSGLDDECVTGVCGDGGVCVEENKPDDTDCQDGNICTENDKCASGVCVAGSLKDCTAEDTDCAVGKCNTESGLCYAVAREGSPSCEDGNLCTVGDYCDGMTCITGSDKDCSSLDTECITGVCQPLDGACVEQEKADNTDCFDGNYCTLADRCLSGVCTPQSTKDCSDDKDCTDDICTPETGACSNPIQNGSCLIDGTCYANGDPHPEDSACLSCVDSSPEAWTLASGYCYIDGVCVENNDPHPTQPDCQYCYADETLGNLYAWTIEDDETACSDNDECTLNDRCLSGVCTSTEDKQCAESPTNPCWLPFCISPAGSCSFNTFGREGENCTSTDSNVVNAICENSFCVGDSLPLDTDAEGNLIVTRYVSTKGTIANICLVLETSGVDPSTFVAYFTSPTGTKVTVYDHLAGSDPLYYTVQLADYAGEDKLGLWTLEINADSAAPATTLSEFSFTFSECDL